MHTARYAGPIPVGWCHGRPPERHLRLQPQGGRPSDNHGHVSPDVPLGCSHSSEEFDRGAERPCSLDAGYLSRGPVERCLLSGYARVWSGGLVQPNSRPNNQCGPCDGILGSGFLLIRTKRTQQVSVYSLYWSYDGYSSSEVKPQVSVQAVPSLSQI